ncbi:MAG: terminase small subunit protein [Verrucomicrobiota bacterium JB024]|nr:terminase small subunit protein [Verrucomicrobiota bacterium JB024]
MATAKKKAPARKRAKEGRKPGRPSKYSAGVGDAICERLAQGESLRSVCQEGEYPNAATVYRWLREHEEFRHNYARAKQDGADAMAEDILDIADDGTNDWMEKYGKEGESLGWMINGEAVQRSKLRIEARKWLMAKLLPKKYGDKLELDGNALTPSVIVGLKDLKKAAGRAGEVASDE